MWTFEGINFDLEPNLNYFLIISHLYLFATTGPGNVSIFYCSLMWTFWRHQFWSGWWRYFEVKVKMTHFKFVDWTRGLGRMRMMWQEVYLVCRTGRTFSKLVGTMNQSSQKRNVQIIKFYTSERGANLLQYTFGWKLFLIWILKFQVSKN